MDVKNLDRFRRNLLLEKQRLIDNSRNAVKTELTLSQDDLPDETDLAAVEISQNLMFKLRDRERQMIFKIDLALSRIDSGTFGTCLDCEEPIESRRLEARPISDLCVSCQEREEHKTKVYA